ncbi:dihydroorotase [Achromobacter aloeverae]|uniref:Allantoinase n=1 Tax=Achromobacter aloeverae TaxID=1750518 RepID=A0A4Q1HI06_9BURK|nr:amidohydrolase family protein [Achromobacter aloeverae]RXN87818.1 allantoinase [Achromobacter aloeverae]
MNQRLVDLVITNGTVHTPEGSVRQNVCVLNGRIVGLADDANTPPAARVIDARGLDVLPGLWHVHCHFREPGHTYKEDFTSGTTAAAAGGITFCIDMTNNDPHPTTLEAFELKRSTIAPKALVDYALYGGGLYPKTVAPLAKAGAIGIKVFNTRHVKEVYPYISELGVVDHGILHELYEAVADTGLLCAVHHDDSEWCKRLTFRDYINPGKTSNRDYMEAYEKGYMYGHGMAAGLAASTYYARITGVRLHVLHMGVMPPAANGLVRFARQQGVDISGEMETAALFMTREQAEKVGPGAYAWAYAPEANWRAVHDGTADMLVGEHAPHTLEEITPGWQDNFSVPLGVTGAQEFIPMVLNAVNQGQLTLQDVARLCAEAPAKRFGQYPKKGRIQIGADADFTIVDMKAENLFKAADMHTRAGYTAYEGISTQGMPVYTIVRGSTVMDHGKIVGQPGHGQFHPGIAAT